MMSLLRYFAQLTPGRIVLWCYAVWYVGIVSRHFDPRPGLWLTSLGLSVIIGIALILSTRHTAGGQPVKSDGWQTFRLFLMPFCVSSFAALVKDEGFFLIFPPSMQDNLIGAAGIVSFLLLLLLLRRPKV